MSAVTQYTGVTFQNSSVPVSVAPTKGLMPLHFFILHPMPFAVHTCLSWIGHMIFHLFSCGLFIWLNEVWVSIFICKTSGQPVLRTECLREHQFLPPRSTKVITLSSKSESWLLILSISIVDLPPPRINKGDHLFTWKWKLTVDPLHINHRPPPQDQQRRSPLCDRLRVDCRPPYISNL